MRDRTLTIIKPECVAEKHIGNIIQRIEEAEFEIKAIKMVRLSKREAEIFYKIHRERPFYRELVEYISSGKVVVMILEKENCIEDFRRFIGATDPQKAEKGTIRSDFGKNIQYNCIHASDSKENANIECAFFFSTQDIIAGE